MQVSLVKGKWIEIKISPSDQKLIIKMVIEDNGFGSIVGERTLCYAEGHEFDPTWRRRDFTNLDI